MIVAQYLKTLKFYTFESELYDIYIISHLKKMVQQAKFGLWAIVCQHLHKRKGFVSSLFI